MLKLLALVAVIAVAASGSPVGRQETEASIKRFDGRIINGTETTIEANPHQISIQLRKTGHWCGGSIISENWVLTAAHCLTYKLEDYMVLAGTANQFEGGSLHRVAKKVFYVIDPTNENEPGSPDIALLQVKDPFVFDKTRQPVRLYNKDEETVAGSMAVVSGWGTTGYEYPDILHSVEVPIITKARCTELYHHIDKGEICAAYEEGGKDACQGDSGGPLTVEGRLAGVVSWGLDCAKPKQPGVYAEVAFYRDWIKDNSQV